MPNAVVTKKRCFSFTYITRLNSNISRWVTDKNFSRDSRSFQDDPMWSRNQGKYGIVHFDRNIIIKSSFYMLHLSSYWCQENGKKSRKRGKAIAWRRKVENGAVLDFMETWLNNRGHRHCLHLCSYQSRYLLRLSSTSEVT